MSNRLIVIDSELFNEAKSKFIGYEKEILTMEITLGNKFVIQTGALPSANDDYLFEQNMKNIMEANTPLLKTPWVEYWTTRLKNESDKGKRKINKLVNVMILKESADTLLIYPAKNSASPKLEDRKSSKKVVDVKNSSANVEKISMAISPKSLEPNSRKSADSRETVLSFPVKSNTIPNNNAEDRKSSKKVLDVNANTLSKRKSADIKEAIPISPIQGKIETNSSITKIPSSSLMVEQIVKDAREYSPSLQVKNPLENVNASPNELEYRKSSKKILDVNANKSVEINETVLSSPKSSVPVYLMAENQWKENPVLATTKSGLVADDKLKEIECYLPLPPPLPPLSSSSPKSSVELRKFNAGNRKSADSKETGSSVQFTENPLATITTASSISAVDRKSSKKILEINASNRKSVEVKESSNSTFDIQNLIEKKSFNNETQASATLKREFISSNGTDSTSNKLKEVKISTFDGIESKNVNIQKSKFAWDRNWWKNITYSSGFRAIIVCLLIDIFQFPFCVAFWVLAFALHAICFAICSPYVILGGFLRGFFITPCCLKGDDKEKVSACSPLLQFALKYGYFVQIALIAWCGVSSALLGPTTIVSLSGFILLLTSFWPFYIMFVSPECLNRLTIIRPILYRGDRRNPRNLLMCYVHKPEHVLLAENILTRQSTVDNLKKGIDDCKSRISKLKDMINADETSTSQKNKTLPKILNEIEKLSKMSNDQIYRYLRDTVINDFVKANEKKINASFNSKLDEMQRILDIDYNKKNKAWQSAKNRAQDRKNHVLEHNRQKIAIATAKAITRMAS